MNILRDIMGLGTWLVAFSVSSVLVAGDDAPAPGSGCQDLLESFAYVSANFTYCAIIHARPIRLCKDCIGPYLKVRKVYDDIMDLEDTGGEVCKDQLFNLDRLQVVDSGFNYVTQLWQRASCDTCFVLDSKKCPTTKLIPEVSNIWNASQVLEDCIKEHRNDSTEGLYDPEVCYTCGKAYENINEKYNLIKAITGDINFCMDVVDLINSTRSSWSRELGCCQDRKRPELVFLIMSAFIALAPVIFYGLAYVWPWRKQEGLLLARQSRWRIAKTVDAGDPDSFDASSPVS